MSKFRTKVVPPARVGWVRRVVAPVLSQVLAGCPGDDPDIPCPTDPAVVEVGSGMDVWAVLEAGGPLSIFHGPQGGYHVYGSLRAANLDPGNPDDPYDPDNPRVSFELQVDGASVGSFVDQPRALTVGDDGWASYIGQTVLLDVADPPALDGVPAIFRAAVSDRCGGSAEDEREVVLHYEGR